MTQRQQQALRIMGDHSIFFAFANFESDPDDENIFIVADLDSVLEENGIDDIDDLDIDDFAIPDYSPDWLYDVMSLFDADEYVESFFQFQNEDDVEEFKEICDFVLD